jgi:hypothetical protein
MGKSRTRNLETSSVEWPPSRRMFMQVAAATQSLSATSQMAPGTRVVLW